MNLDEDAMLAAAIAASMEVKRRTRESRKIDSIEKRKKSIAMGLKKKLMLMFSHF